MAHAIKIKAKARYGDIGLFVSSILDLSNQTFSLFVSSLIRVRSGMESCWIGVRNGSSGLDIGLFFLDIGSIGFRRI